MEVHDALNFALIGVGRGDNQPPIKPYADGDQRQSPKNPSAFSYRLSRRHNDSAFNHLIEDQYTHRHKYHVKSEKQPQP
jgi:hypothetical protein